MNTKTKTTVALLVLFGTLLPITTSFNIFKVKNSAVSSDKPGAAEQVIGPVNPDVMGNVYNKTVETVQTASTTLQPAALQTQPTAAAAATPTSSQPSRTVSRGGLAGLSGQVIGRSPVIGSYSQTDLYWLAKMVQAEAAAEPYNGQVAVAAVILHRVASPTYPNTIKGVLFQVIDGHYQFTPVQNGYINQVEPNATAYKAANAALAGTDPSRGAIIYYNPKTSTSKWILSRPITVVIGNHTFAK